MIITSGLFRLIAFSKALATFFEGIVPKIKGALTWLSENIPTSLTNPGNNAEIPTLEPCNSCLNASVNKAKPPFVDEYVALKLSPFLNVLMHLKRYVYN